MTFSEKLVFLMELTSTANKQLADAVKVDPSLISLIRTGRREPSKKSAHTGKMAEYFAKRCDEGYRRAALSEALGIDAAALDEKRLEATIFAWLSDSRAAFRRAGRGSAVNGAEAGEGARTSDGFVGYGNAGKREAVAALLEQLSDAPPAELLISTDESLDWLYEDASFRAWTEERLMALIRRGYTVRRIYFPHHASERAAEAMAHWMPLCLAGSVESYYFPRMRDGLRRRTLIAVAGEAAVISFSAGDRTEARVTRFTRDRQLADAFAADFEDELAKCRPMVTSFAEGSELGTPLRRLLLFENDAGDCIRQSATLSLVTAPFEVAEAATKRMSGQEASRMLDAVAAARGAFRQSLTDCETVDILSVATAAEVREGRVPIAASCLCGETVYYTVETYARHIESIISFIDGYPNYRALICPRSEGCVPMMVKDGGRVLVLRAEPLTVFELSPPSLAEACREYLMSRAGALLPPDAERKRTRAALEKLLRELRRG